MSERNKLTEKIRNELKDCKSNRKATLKLLSLVSDAEIFLGNYCVSYNFEGVYDCPKSNGTSFIAHCKMCRITYVNNVEIKINFNTVGINLCAYCKNKTLCSGCLRESSRCSLIHTRKLLCYKFLLSQKFPKDVIRLITKKVK